MPVHQCGASASSWHARLHCTDFDNCSFARAMTPTGPLLAGLHTKDQRWSTRHMPTTHITLPAEPEAITLTMARTALLLIDMQRDFIEPGGFGATLGNDVSQLARTIA